MAHVTLQVLDGVDRGRIYRNLATTVTLGREEGNTIQLNDERVSRFHAKIQEDQGQLVLTDLESTNGTRVNGEPVQISILRVGDRISVGRSLLLLGSPEEIDQQLTPVSSSGERHAAEKSPLPPVDRTRPMAGTGHLTRSDMRSDELRFELNFRGGDSSVHPATRADEATPKPPPDLPVKLSPAQAAQLYELLLHLHQLLTTATSGVQNAEDGGARLTRAAWQRILRVEMELAQYIHRIGHPE